MEDCGSSQSNQFWQEALGEIPDDNKKESSESFENFSQNIKNELIITNKTFEISESRIIEQS